MTPAQRDDLDRAAFAVADEYQAGKLPRGPLAHQNDSWAAIRAVLAQEIEQRCPGFAPDEYLEALQRALRDSR